MALYSKAEASSGAWWKNTNRPRLQMSQMRLCFEQHLMQERRSLCLYRQLLWPVKYCINITFLWDCMVDCRPRRSRGRQCFLRGGDIIYLIVYYVFIFDKTSMLCFSITLRTGRQFSWMSTVAMALLKIPLRPQFVSQIEPYEQNCRAVDIFIMSPSLYNPWITCVTFRKMSPVQFTNQISWN